MKKQTYVRKLGVLDVCNLTETERWLNAMAAEGLRLKKFGNLWVTFEKSEVVPALYRIVAIADEPFKKRPEVTQEPGWNFVDKKRSLAVYAWYSEENPTFDHEVFREELEWVDAMVRHNGSSAVVSVLLMFAMMMFLWNDYLQHPPTTFEMVTRSRDVLILVSLTYLWLVGASFLSYAASKKWLDRLQNDVSETVVKKKGLDPYRFWLILIYLQWFIFTTMVLLVMLDTGVINANGFLQSKDLPLVKLSSVEKDWAVKNLVEKPTRTDKVNQYLHRFSFLAPVQYKTSEGVTSGNSQSDVQGGYQPSVYNEYYWLTFSNMGNAFTEELMMNYSGGSIPNPLRLVHHKGFDQLYVSEGPDSCMIVGRKGHSVLYVAYQGNAKLPVLIEAAAKALGSK